MEVMKLKAEVEEGNEREVFCEHPHSTLNNCLSEDQIMNWISGNGFGARITCRRYLLLEEI